MSKQTVRKMILQQASVTNKAEKKRYADKIRIIHRVAALSCPDGNRKKLPLQVFWKGKKAHRILSEGSGHLNSTGAMEQSPNDEDFVESSTGESTFSKIFACACISYISCPLATHTEHTFSLQHRTTTVLQIKANTWYLVICLEKSGLGGTLFFFFW